ncbi:UNVERIFIED_CONTAM: hypothetical protein GTU68_002445 [Idotea baltica]|nr:hypothetical protein [Idotea baltica]
MIEYNFEKKFNLNNIEELTAWITKTIEAEGFREDILNYVFCDDEYLLKINVKHLKHNTLTDIITFNYSVGKLIASDIFISVDRVIENAEKFSVSFTEELHRVMIHGILHLCGYDDKGEKEKMLMRKKEDYYLSLLAV